MIQKILLIIKELFSGIFISIIVFTVIAVAAFSIGSFVRIVNSVEKSIIQKFESAVPPDVIKVSPPFTGPTGILDFLIGKNGTPGLDKKSVAFLSGLKGVKAVYPLNASRIPMQAVISFFGLNYRTDLVCIGAPEEFIGKDINGKDNKKEWKDWKPGMELPVLIPEILLDAYNNSMAEPNGLPRITKNMAIGRDLRIIFGKSSVREVEGFSSEMSRVTGFTDKVKSICLVIPLQAVRFYNNKFKGGIAGDSYICAYVLVSSHTSLISVSDRIEKSGFIVETDKALSEEMLSFKRKLESIFFLLTNIVFLLALLSMTFSAMIAAFNRMDYYNLLRILGASRFFLTLSLLFKYSVIGFAGSFCGFFIMQKILGFYVSSLKIQGFEIVLLTGTVSIWSAAGAGALISMIASIPALFLIQSGKMDPDQ